MEKTFKIALILLISLFIYNCNNTNQNQERKSKVINKITALKKKTIILPDSLMVINKDTIIPIEQSNLYAKESIKIVTNIDGNCNACIQQLKKWKELINWAKQQKQLNILSYIQVNDMKQFKEKIYHDVSVKNYPLIIDKNYSFLEQNNMPGDIKYHTLLLGKNNKPVLVGNPAYNTKLMKLYKEEINRRMYKQ
jgi:hypothetical protein